MRYQDRLESRVKERIVDDLAAHEITVLHADGLYRHWRCSKPGDSNMRFDIVTWPGSLCYTGDMGEFLFQRTNDMVAFMRGSSMSYDYAAEKCVASRDGTIEWSEEKFREVLAERLKECDTFTVCRHGAQKEENVSEAVEQIEREYSNYSSQFDAEKAMYESGLWDGCDMPSCKDFTHRFLWCLHAIKWFCDRVVEAQ